MTPSLRRAGAADAVLPSRTAAKAGGHDYELRLGPLAWALRFLAVPPPGTWLQSPAARLRRLAPRLGAGPDAEVLCFAYRPPALLAAATADDAAGDPADGWAAVDPDSGELNEVGWRRDGRLVARRDGAVWAVATPREAPAAGAPARLPDPAGAAIGGWTIALSDRRPRVVTQAFFELVLPFLAGAAAARRGGFPFHGNALLGPTPRAGAPRPALVLSGPSGAGKSTLSRWVCRTQRGWELFAEDRLLIVPDEGERNGDAGGRFCVAAWPTTGEGWLRSIRNVGCVNDLRGVVFLGHGNANRWEALDAEEAFPLLWEQGLTALVPPGLRAKVVDTQLRLAANGLARKYSFLPGPGAAELVVRDALPGPD